MSKNKNLHKFCLIGLLASSVMAAKSNSFDINDLDISFKMKASNLESTLDKSTKLSTSLFIKGDLNLNSDLKLFFDGGLKFEDASSKSTFLEKRFNARSGLKYDHVFVNYNPFKPLHINVGVLDNGNTVDSSPFVTNSVGTLGVQQKLIFGTDTFKANLTAQQAKPVSDELVQRIGDVETGDPKFFQESGNLTFDNKALRASVTLGHFAYQDLASSVAAQDFYYGNSVTSLDPQTSTYEFSFQGWFYNLEGDIIFNENRIGAFYYGIKNDKAQEGKDTGYSFGGEIETKILDTKVELRVVHFENDSDSAPAFYTNYIARGKYKGEAVRLRTEDPEGMRFELSYTDRKEQSPDVFYLADEKLISISIGKSYDIF